MYGIVMFDAGNVFIGPMSYSVLQRLTKVDLLYAQVNVVNPVSRLYFPLLLESRRWKASGIVAYRSVPS